MNFRQNKSSVPVGRKAGVEIGKRRTVSGRRVALCFDLGGGCTDMFTSDNSLSCVHLTCILLAVCVTLQLKSKPEVFKRLSKIATSHIKNFKFVDLFLKKWEDPVTQPESPLRSRWPHLCVGCPHPLRKAAGPPPLSDVLCLRTIPALHAAPLPAQIPQSAWHVGGPS